MNFKLLSKALLGLLMIFAFSANSQTTNKVNFSCEEIPSQNIAFLGTPQIQASQYKVFQMDIESLKSQLIGISHIDDPTGFIAQVSLPHPDGNFHSYVAKENATMHKELAAKFPEIKAYNAVGINNNATVKWDITQHGFHAMIMIPGESSIYIDPLIKGNTDYYIVYHKSDFMTNKLMECGVITSSEKSNSAGGPKSLSACDLRTYRLALAATGEYTAFHGGTVAGALAAQVTSMNRVNGLYETDLGISMTIIANNNLIIFTNAGTDPYTNNSGGVMLNENQNEIDATIGSANYDIGHVFSTGGGGIAQLFSPCSSNKARGVTGSGNPVGDPFDIDYVAHEMGHQFGANHTQNNNCNRNGATAMEPGSASTIMGYAGICAPNVQNNSDDHFHGISMQEIDAFITNAGSGGSCPVITPLANTAPSITGTNGSGITLPVSTPFALTAIATDPNANTLTYCWEQMDNNVATMPPVASSTSGPNFRSNSPSTSPTRYFPNLADLAAGISPTWEVIPSVTRNMDFRVSVRDNAVGGGCTDNSDITVSFDGNSGPFIVTYPSATGISWAALTTETVTWDVANTDVAPVACANVDILLSTDGGLTYPTVLATNVPNDGTELISVPNVATTTARIMVVCSNGTFFDISDNDFTITMATFDYTLATTPATISICQPNDAVYTIDIGSVGGYNDPVTLSVTGIPAGATANFSVNPVTPVGQSILTISNTGAAIPGTYPLTITGVSTSGTKTNNVTLIISSGNPTAVAQLTPADAATGVSVPTTFTWTTASGAGVTYEIDIATDLGFTAIVDQATGLVPATYNSTVLLSNTTYYWRVRSVTGCGSASWSSAFSFTTSTCTTTPSTNIPVAISATGSPTITSTITIPTGGIINDVNVLNLTGQHTWISDLTITLTSPGATTVTLFSSVCNNEDDWDLNFDDGATAGGLPCPPVGGGTYQPASVLSAFNGEDQAGVWTLTIDDAFNQDGGSLDSWSLEICVDPPACAVVASAVVDSNTTCNGFFDGGATASVTGGTSPYTYAWSNSATTQSITGVGAGIYNVTITDANGCTATSSVTITQPSALVASAVVDSNTTCNGFFDGGATASATGGTSPYTYAWSNSATTESITGVGAGIYNVTITDANGCTATASVTITQPSALMSAITSLTNIACNGGATGLATVTPSGGTAPYTFLWDAAAGSQTTATANGLGAGTYTVTITDANGCTTTSSATINEPTLLVATTSSTDETCVGNDATATVTPSGGTAPYTFLWDAAAGSQTGATATALAAGTYSVTVTDANGCTGISSVIVNDGCCGLTSSITALTNVSCNGGTNGAATVSAAGGAAPYTFLWDAAAGSQTTATAVGLGAGTYLVVVTEANGCTSTSTVTITDPSALVASAVVDSNTTCNGFFDGGATASVTGGTSPYTYAWSNSATTQSITGVGAGIYNVTITDANGCTATSSVTITQPSALTSAITSLTNIACNGGTAGLATVTPSGGTSPYTFLWDAAAGSQTTATANGLGAGTYTVTITDVNGCTTTSSATISEPTLLVATTNSLNSSCNVVCDGSVGSSASGGTAPYTYSWDGGLGGGQNFNGVVCAGTYNATVIDANGCTATSSVDVFAVDGIAPSITCPSDQTICSTSLPSYISMVMVNDACDVSPTVTQLPAPGTSVSGTTLVTIIAMDASGNSNSCTFNVTLNPTYSETAVATICAGDTYSFGAQTLTSQGTYTELFSSVNGCDSTVVLTLTVNSGYLINENVAICNGASYMFPDGTTGTTTQVYTSTLVSVGGCDSTIVTALTVNQPTVMTEDVEICEGSSHTFPDGSVGTITQAQTSVLTGVNGCDSIIVTALTVHSAYNYSESVVICLGDTYMYPDGTIGSIDETHTSFLATSNGCDSTIVTNLSIETIDNSVVQSGSLLTANQTGATYQWIDCDNGNAIIPGETNQSYTATSVTGNYAVVLSTDICSDTSDCYMVDLTSVEALVGESVSIFPNPTDGSVTITWKGEVDRIEVTDAKGKLIKQVDQFSGNSYQLELVDYSAGVYFIHIESKYGRTVHDLMKR